MSKHRATDFKRAWHQKRHHYTHLAHQFRLWIAEQRQEVRDILEELKQRGQ